MMVGAISISVNTLSTKTTDLTITVYDTVYVEDDKYLRKGWELYAKKAGVKLLTVANPDEFFKHINEIDKDKTDIYIDRELGDEWPKGEDFATTLHNQGFQKLFLATGYDASMFEHLSWLKCTGKESPWETEDEW